MKQKLRLPSLVLAIVALAVLCISCGQNSPSLDSRLFVIDLEDFPNSQSLVWWEDIQGPEDLGIEVWPLRSDKTTSIGLENGVYAEYRNSILGGSVTTIILSFKNMNAARKAYSLLAEPIGGGDPDTRLLYNYEQEVFRSRIGEDSIVYDHQYQAYAPLGGPLFTSIRVVTRSSTVVVLVHGSGEDEVRGRAEPIETAYFANLASMIITKVEAKEGSAGE